MCRNISKGIFPPYLSVAICLYAFFSDGPFYYTYSNVIGYKYPDCILFALGGKSKQTCYSWTQTLRVWSRQQCLQRFKVIRKKCFDDYNFWINLVPSPLLMTSLLWKFDRILQEDSVKYICIYIHNTIHMYQFVKKILMAPDIQGYKRKVFWWI